MGAGLGRGVGTGDTVGAGPESTVRVMVNVCVSASQVDPDASAFTPPQFWFEEQGLKAAAPVQSKVAVHPAQISE